MSKIKRSPFLILRALIVVALVGASPEARARDGKSSSQRSGSSPNQSAPSKRVFDPGVRTGAAGAGGPVAGLTTDELEMFRVGLEDFALRGGG